ncbi:MAG: heavy-metal-associated domain-containing protein [Tetrasphaera sp.]|nr:heavy-metal-associated domain-containing protein [Tetrasphaera sp.]
MTDNSSTTQSLQLRERSGHGCGCGGCGCGAGADSSATELATTSASTQTFEVTGMTCGHCTSAVTAGLQALDGVNDVEIDLVADGTSRVTVHADALPSRDDVAAALDEAGGYRLV